MKKKALITGASRGIGKAIAVAFAAAGYDLYITCIHSKDALIAFASELERDYNITVSTFIGDLGDYTFVEEMFHHIDTLDVLVNNAGISHIGLLSDMDVCEWHQVIDTNLTSVFYTSKHTIPLMLTHKSGRIINISSVWGNVGASMEVAYSTSKGGINAFTKALAKELAPSNIQVNAIACGVIDTDMNKVFDEEDIKNLREEIPADRLGQADEVAKLTLQLADAPSYLTGQIITLDGGWI
ncbi:MAG: SDR family NAD(P)-dependent oxidoreductase [Lachnospiraceae bacterium]|nr:SDR family NAD(P)-dependent oxidoreductase [Lachnospiraceae bacterium]